MSNNTEIQVAYIHQNLTEDECRIIEKLYQRIKQNRDANGRLWVNDWRTCSSHHWKGTTKAELARQFGLSHYGLELLMEYIAFDGYKNGRPEKLQQALDRYQPGKDVDIHNVIRWALSYLLDDHKLIDLAEKYEVNEE